MLHQLNDDVYFGNWQAPVEAAQICRSIINVAHSFSARRGRNAYWAELEKVKWETFYTRLAKKDGQLIDEAYWQAFKQAVMSARYLDKLPLLTHCQMGGHRGPTAAVAASFILSGFKRSVLQDSLAKVLAISSGLRRGEGRPGGHNYHRSMLAFCESEAV